MIPLPEIFRANTCISHKLLCKACVHDLCLWSWKISFVSSQAIGLYNMVKKDMKKTVPNHSVCKVQIFKLKTSTAVKLLHFLRRRLSGKFLLRIQPGLSWVVSTIFTPLSKVKDNHWNWYGFVLHIELSFENHYFLRVLCLIYFCKWSQNDNFA